MVEFGVAVVSFTCMLVVWHVAARPKPKHRNRRHAATVVLEWVQQHR